MASERSNSQVERSVATVEVTAVAEISLHITSPIRVLSLSTARSRS